ncbi:MFS transporter [Virgisporangium aliadipatigenens]|uniref:MFS transporter n=1 Tax=Virgisporangium aliadipatigenens TaxID=741659 RepID=A0A8J4DNV1_9ACTN|nr:MFS transporter [Virgisporangium aliadipatigenens]GIJ43872.1 MFS transporter [Virgisporangium aliadipatigenens]
MCAHLGGNFSKLWAASAVSNLGDGVTMAAGPLLVASITTAPAAVAGAAFAQQLPWLLFALVSGAFVDRLDRRRLIVAVNLCRGLALAVLAFAVVLSAVSVPVVYVVFFLLGTGETLVDTAAGALLPAIVPASGLARANARLYATFTIGNQFVAKPLGAWLFGVSAAAPFGFDAVTFLLAALLVARIRVAPAPAPARSSLREEVAEGLRWLWRHRLLRTLAMSMGIGNVAFGAAFAVFVLYCRARLGLSAVGFGFLLTAFAVGGLVGTALVERLTRLVGASVLLRVGLFVEAATHAVLGFTTSGLVASAVLVGFGAHAMVWGITVVSLRQRVVPAHLLGRVGGVYSLLDLGGAALGTLLGGLLASMWGLAAPLRCAAAVMLVVALLAWRPLRGAATREAVAGSGVPGRP